MNPRRTSRFPARVYGTGVDPDARFSLANERTYLAWLRTSIALIAASAALEVLGAGIHPGLRAAASILLVIAGLTTPVVAWLDWMAKERALRSGGALHASRLTLPIGCTVFLAGLLVLAGTIHQP